jgi:hypothetical protein
MLIKPLKIATTPCILQIVTVINMPAVHCTDPRDFCNSIKLIKTVNLERIMPSALDDEKVSSLQTDLRSYGQEISEHISTLFTSTRAQTDELDLKNDPANIMLMLKMELTQIIETSLEQNEYAIKHSVEIKECSSLISSLSSMSAITEMLIDCEKAITTFNFIPACEILRKIEHSLKSLPSHNSEIGSGKVCLELKNEAKILASKLNSKLRRCLDECIRIEHGRIGVTKILKGVLRSEDLVLEEAPLHLADVWRAIVITGKTSHAVCDILNKFWCCIVQPVWSEKKAHFPRVSMDGDCAVDLVLDGLTGRGSAEMTGHGVRGDSGNSQFVASVVNSRSSEFNVYFLSRILT